MKKTVLHILIFTTVFIFTACGKESTQTGQTFKVATNTWPGYEGLYLAENLDYYKGKGIEIIRYPSASEVVKAFEAGFVDMAALTIDEVISIAERGHKPKVLLIMDFSNGGDAIIGNAGMSEMVDLKAKRVGVENSALGAFFLSRALEESGMMANDILEVPLQVDEHEAAFKDGIVDAVVTFDPVRANLLKSGGSLLFDSSRIPGEIVDVLIIKDSNIEKKESQIQNLLTGWFRAIDYLNKNNQKAAQIIAPMEKLSPEEFIASLKGLYIPGIAENVSLLTGEKHELFHGITKLQMNMKSSGMLVKSFSPEDIIDARPTIRVKN